MHYTLAAVDGSLSDGLALMIVGMLVVFVALVVLLAIIAAMNRLMPDPPDTALTPAPNQRQINDGWIDEKLLAVIAAAATAAVGQAVQVQAVRRLSTDEQRAWSRSGRRRIMQSHRPHR